MAQSQNPNNNNISLAGKVLILDGPPASGKGSIAQYLNQQFGCIHISTGDIFRDHVRQKTELGRQVQKYLDMKSFIPDQLVVNHVLDRLSQPDVKQYGCILDGFPRTPQQFAALQKANIKIDQVITIQCPDKVLIKRAKGRRINPSTGTIYHINYVPPPKNIKVIKRDMDNNIKSRLDVYHAQHRRFKFKSAGNINANKPLKDVFKDVMHILKQLHAKNDNNNEEELIEINENEVEVKPKECSICMNNLSDHIIVPCGHQCGCKECLTKLKQSGGKCPMCRGRINIIQKVFASHTVNAKKKKKKKGNVGAPKMQKIENIAKNILNEDKPNDNEEWPEDAKDNEDIDDDIKMNDVDNNNNEQINVRIRIANNHNNVQNIVLELTGSEKKGRCPVDICAVLDTSGSMCSSAAVQEDDGNVKKDDGLSILDCVKHSVKTVINCLSKNDRFSIVAFNSDAKLHYDLNFMTPPGVKKAVNALEQLQPGGQTNIWSGLRCGMECLRKKQKSDRLSVILLLTDGRPVIIPPKGHIFELTKYLDEHNLCVQINTFGFGYDLDSDLLHSLSVHGNGTFAFIPDAKIVGTTFVNSISNVLTTISAETRLYLTATNGSKFIGPCFGSYKELDESWGRVIDIGPIMCGSTRFISLQMSIPNNNKPYLECQISTTVLGSKGKSTKIKKNFVGVQRTIANDLLAGYLTAKTVSIGLEATKLANSRKGNAAMKLIKLLKSEIKSATDIAKSAESDDTEFDQLTANSRLEALNNDVSGRFSKAFRGETRFNRWGKHYLRALLRSHQLNMCTNFMDPGLQVNGGNLFRELRAKGDEVFVNLAPPKPSRRTGPSQHQYYNNNNNNNNQQQQQYIQRQIRQPPPQQVRQPAPDMRDYYGGSGGGCFSPNCNVIVMENNNNNKIFTKQICDVKPGDMVKVAGNINEFAKVVFVVELKRDPNRRMIKFPNGLVITGGHPVRRNGVWCLPREQSDVQHTKGCNTVFTFVLDKSHVIIVGGVECITWGHFFGTENIVNHSFFGTEKVIQGLKQKAMDLENGMNDTFNRYPLDNVIAIYQ